MHDILFYYFSVLFSNKLLFREYSSCAVQVSDFGLAKLALEANTHITTRVMGTFGYVGYLSFIAQERLVLYRPVWASSKFLRYLNAQQGHI